MKQRALSKPMSVQAALHWAFVTEGARLEFPKQDDEPRPAVSNEYVMMERAKLGGVRIDTSQGRSEPHVDADTVAQTVAAMPEQLGGGRTALTIVDLARLNETPDWMQGAEPRIVPLDWNRRNRNGQMAKSAVHHRESIVIRTPHPKNPARFIERRMVSDVLWCPCTWQPSAQEIAHARRRYLDWWNALDWIRLMLEQGKLFDLQLNRQMPPQRPWATASAILVKRVRNPGSSGSR